MQVSLALGGFMSDKTKEKILEASMTLFMTKGYKKTTTKAIAEAASVNEVTLFRLFGKKKNIVEAVVKNKSFDMEAIKIFFEKSVTYNVVDDLYKGSLIHYETISKNLPLVMTLIDELGEDFTKVFAQLPEKMIKIYKAYFTELVERDMILSRDIDVLAELYNNFVSGLAMTKGMTKDYIMHEAIEKYLLHHAEIFSKGILK